MGSKKDEDHPMVAGLESKCFLGSDQSEALRILDPMLLVIVVRGLFSNLR